MKIRQYFLKEMFLPSTAVLYFLYRIINTFPTWSQNLHFELYSFIGVLVVAPIALFLWYTEKINQKNKDEREIHDNQQSIYRGGIVSFWLFGIIAFIFFDPGVSTLYFFIFIGIYWISVLYTKIKYLSK